MADNFKEPFEYQRVCFNCRFWQSLESFQYDCKFNGPYGGCEKFENKEKHPLGMSFSLFETNRT